MYSYHHRRLPKEKIIPLMKEQVERSSMDSTVVSFQEAAAQLCKTGYGLSSSQRKALNDFMDKISCLSKGVNSNSLPDFLRYLWTNSGLEKFYRKRNKESDDEQDDDEQEDEHYVPYISLSLLRTIMMNGDSENIRSFSIFEAPMVVNQELSLLWWGCQENA